MAAVNLEQAALGIAVLSVALNLWVLLRLMRDAPVTLVFAGTESCDCGDATGCRDKPVGVPLYLELPQNVRAVRNSHRCSRLKPVRQADATRVVVGDNQPLASEAASLKRDLANRNCEIAGVDHLDATDPLVPLNDVHGRVPDSQPDRVLADQPHGVEDAERSAQHRNP